MDYSNENTYLKNIKDKLKPTICESCKADGCFGVGTCKKCMTNHIYNKEYVETHLFIVDDYLQDYHCRSNGHDYFKGMFYRNENEHPYLYYGIELEIGFDYDYVQVFRDEDYDDWSPTDEITDILKEFSRITDGMFVYEKDGSVQNGVELISRPTSYAKWTDPETVEKLKKGLEYLKSEGAYLEQPNGNGMHIHISKKFFDFGKTEREQRDEAYQELDWLFQFYQPEFEKIAGRKYTGYCRGKMQMIKDRYCFGTRSFDDLYKAELKEEKKMKKGGMIPREDHSFALIMSGRTVEARIFQSTINYKQVLANIEFMRNLAHAVRDKNVEGKTLEQILATKDGTYLDERVQTVKKECAKTGDELNMGKVVEYEMEIK